MDNSRPVARPTYTRPSRVFKSQPSTPFIPGELNSDEIKIIRNIIKYRKRGKFNINMNVIVELDFDFAMQLAEFVVDNYRGNDPAIHKFAEEMLAKGRETTKDFED